MVLLLIIVTTLLFFITEASQRKLYTEVFILPSFGNVTKSHQITIPQVVTIGRYKASYHSIRGVDTTNKLFAFYNVNVIHSQFLRFMEIIALELCRLTAETIIVIAFNFQANHHKSLPPIFGSDSLTIHHPEAIHCAYYLFVVILEPDGTADLHFLFPFSCHLFLYRHYTGWNPDCKRFFHDFLSREIDKIFHFFLYDWHNICPSKKRTKCFS